MEDRVVVAERLSIWWHRRDFLLPQEAVRTVLNIDEAIYVNKE